MKKLFASPLTVATKLYSFFIQSSLIILKWSYLMIFMRVLVAVVSDGVKAKMATLGLHRY